MRDPNLTPGQRDILRRLVVADPVGSRERIRGQFLAATGRAISRETVARARREATHGMAVATEGPIRPPCPGGSPGLAGQQRSALLALIDAHPAATPGQVAKMFLARTGRMLARQTVRDYIRRRRFPVRPATNNHLTHQERELLASLIRDAAPEFCRSQVAREFVALSGRPIHPTSVGRFMETYLGLPKVAQGSFSASTIRADKARHLAEASVRKLASAPIDRSARPGRTGRVTPYT